MSIIRALIFIAIVAGAQPAAAQISWYPTSSYPADMVRDLPAGGNVFALLESAQPEITTDRFNSGGLNAGERDRISAFLASWTQTQYRILDSVISSPVDGTPMLFPDLAWWDSIDVTAARMLRESTATGLTIDLSPRPVSGKWSGILEVGASGGALTQSSAGSRAPAITQLGSTTRVSAVASGYLMADRLGLSLGGTFTEATTFERRGERQRDTESLFVNAIYAVSPSHRLSALTLLQPGARHLQSTYEPGPHWRFFGGYTDRKREAESMPVFRQADRLYDGPVPALVESTSAERRASAGARSYWSNVGSFRAGVDVDHSSAATDPIANATLFERVDGMPARLWRFTGSGSRSQRHALSLSAFAQDHIWVTRNVGIDAALRFQFAQASASGAATGMAWRTFLPSLHVNWLFHAGPFITILSTGISRTADRPLLGYLAYGDPNAPTADVYRWDGENILPPPLMMRVGPGTGGDPGFSAIDPKLRPPVTDQFILDLETTRGRWLKLRVTGLARRQTSLISVVNIGVPASGYTMFTIPDANADWVNPVDDQQLPVYNRNPETFGQDRYLLTNPDVEDATMGGVIVSAEIAKPRLTFRIGGTASASVGSGGNRGYTAFENDQAVLGELFTNPNASTYARGRLFNDRAYTIKSMAVFRLPAAFTAGILARFQDGQPFSRLAIVPFLNQGAEAIQAFPNGRSRFSYRATLDLRLQKRVDVGTIRFDVIADAYNLLNAASEVEEYVVTGPRFREITAVQPPRSLHLGARVTF
jgi:hypothetical protein